MASYEVSLTVRTVKSTTETLGVGTRKAIPVNLPFNSGMTLPTALAAPVEAGMMLVEAARPSRHFLAEGPSTVFWVAVKAWMVVIKPSSIPKLSLITLARGAKQLVVQEALDMTSMSGVYELSLTPMTNIGASAEGAEITTFLAPPCKCKPAFSLVVKTPVDSTTYSTPALPQGISAGFLIAKTLITCPLTTKFPSLVSTVPLNFPWVESYLNM